LELPLFALEPYSVGSDLGLSVCLFSLRFVEILFTQYVELGFYSW